jgi:hypothetical protein
MTSIKPPGGRVPAAGVDSGAAPGKAEEAERADQASFREQVSGPSGSSAPAAASIAGTTAADPIAQLAQAIRSGTVTREQALEQLVERAVSGLSKTLTKAQRDELTSVLRQALESDPALLELQTALD